MSSLLELRLDDEKTAYFAGNTYSYRNMIKAIPGSRWEKKDKRWKIPLESTEDAVRMFPSLVVSEDVKHAYMRLRRRYDTAVAVKEAIKEASDVPVEIPGLKGKLRPYQAVGKAFLDTLEEGEGAILAFDMGLGKSLTSLAYGVDLINRGVIDYILVVCPSPLKYATWEKEIKKWTDLEYVVIDGDKREVVEWDDGTQEKLTGKRLREVQYQQWMFGTKVIVMNYELFLHDEDILPPIDRRWLVILDEAHRIKNPKAKTTKTLIEKLKSSGRKVLGTGTPLENNIQELYSLVNFCRPNLLGSYRKFIERYAETDFFDNPIGPKPQMLEELRKRIAPIMIRVTKSDVLPDLPELTVQEYWVHMTKKQEELYKQIRDGILQDAKTGEFTYLEVLAQITRVQQVLDSPALLRDVFNDDTLPVESGKLNELKNIISDIDPNRNKFILFSQYREMTDILYDWLIENEVLPKHKIGYVKGGVKSSEIERIRKEFQEGDMQCIVMTTAGNYGLDLYNARYVIRYDQLFNPQKMEQIISRAHRMGNVTGVTAIHIVTRNSYEERKMKILEEKREVFKAVVNEDDEALAKLFTKEELLELL